MIGFLGSEFSKNSCKISDWHVHDSPSIERGLHQIYKDQQKKKTRERALYDQDYQLFCL